MPKFEFSLSSDGQFVESSTELDIDIEHISNERKKLSISGDARVDKVTAMLHDLAWQDNAGLKKNVFVKVVMRDGTYSLWQGTWAQQSDDAIIYGTLYIERA